MTDSKLTDKQKKYVESYCESVEAGVSERESRKLAKLEAGYAETTSITDIVTPEVESAIIMYANRELALTIPRAVQKVKGVMEDPEQAGAGRVLEAAFGLLDRAGVTKKESKEVTVKMPTGLVYLPAKRPLDEEIVTDA